MNLPELSRRRFAQRLAGGAAFAAGVPLVGRAWGAAAGPSARRHKICVFTKPFQSLGYAELAARVAELGFDGIEAPVRTGGHIEPAAVEDELPRLAEALKRRGLEITVLTSSISRVDEPHTEKVLRTAAGLGIQRYRLKYYKYDLKRPVLAQLESIRPALKELAALNRELGVTALYQNHAGSDYVGAPVWDLQILLRDIPRQEIGVAFDIRHATVEGGTAWRLHFHVMRPHLGCVYVKDFRWSDGKPRNVPLGDGQISSDFFSMLKSSGYSGPISLHEEYLDHRDPQKVPEHLAAMKRDLALLTRWLDSA